MLIMECHYNDNNGEKCEVLLTFQTFLHGDSLFLPREIAQCNFKLRSQN